MEGRGPINMADVARHAGVSTATVSRALRDVPGVSDATRKRIKLLADQLSYVVSPEASRLSGGTTGRVAVVVPTINHWFFATILAGIEGTLRGADLDVLIYHVDGAVDRKRFFERLPARRKADAVIVITLPVPEAEARRLELMGTAIVIAGGQLLDYPCVRIDDVEVGYQAVSHLRALGHERVAMIRTMDADGTVWPTDRLRAIGFVSAMADSGLDVPPGLMVTVPWGAEGGAMAMEQLLSMREPPTAVFAYSDEVAMGAMRTLRRAHVPIPERISIVGVDDHPLAELNDLTTVHQPVEEQGEIAARMVLDLLHGRPVTDSHRCVGTYLVVRNSTAPPPAQGWRRPESGPV
jgi:LacI family transcriptional regulator, repressor for deo operon, udp, cdd, tsx, nupC, and nupG